MGHLGFGAGFQRRTQATCSAFAATAPMHIVSSTGTVAVCAPLPGHNRLQPLTQLHPPPPKELQRDRQARRHASHDPIAALACKFKDIPLGKARTVLQRLAQPALGPQVPASYGLRGYAEAVRSVRNRQLFE